MDVGDRVGQMPNQLAIFAWNFELGGRWVGKTKWKSNYLEQMEFKKFMDQ
jgi:hypothetical protein